MGLWPRTYLKWREPKPVRLAKKAREDALRPLWAIPGLILLIFLMFMLDWYLATLDPRKHPVSFQNAVLLAAFGSLFLYLVIRAVPHLPTTIVITDKGIRVDTHPVGFHKYTQRESCRIGRFTASGTDYLVLTVKKRKGRELMFGLSESVSPEELGSLLRDFGVVLLEGEQKGNCIEFTQ